MSKLEKYNAYCEDRHILHYPSKQENGEIDLIYYIGRWGDIEQCVNSAPEMCLDEGITTTYNICVHDRFVYPIFNDTSSDFLYSWNKGFLINFVKKYSIYRYPVIVDDYKGYYKISALLNKEIIDEIIKCNKTALDIKGFDFSYGKLKSSTPNGPIYKFTMRIEEDSCFDSYTDFIITKILKNSISEESWAPYKTVTNKTEIVCCPYCYHPYGTIKFNTTQGRDFGLQPTLSGNCVNCGGKFDAPNKYQMKGKNSIITVDEHMHPIIKLMFEKYHIYSIACCESHPPFDQDMYVYSYAKNKKEYDVIDSLFKYSFFDVETTQNWPEDAKAMVRFTIRLKKELHKKNIKEELKIKYLNEMMSILTDNAAD